MSLTDQLPAHVRNTLHPDVRRLLEQLEATLAQSQQAAASNATIIRGRAHMLGNEMIEALHMMADAAEDPHQPPEGRRNAKEACRLFIDGLDRVRAAASGIELADGALPLRTN